MENIICRNICIILNVSGVEIIGVGWTIVVIVVTIIGTINVWILLKIGIKMVSRWEKGATGKEVADMLKLLIPMNISIIYKVNGNKKGWLLVISNLDSIKDG